MGDTGGYDVESPTYDQTVASAYDKFSPKVNCNAN